MTANANMTIYNAYLDKATRLDKYKRHVINSVFWDDVEGASKARHGLEQADKVLVLIPLNNPSCDRYVAPKEFTGEEGTFTFRVGDRIVKGVTDFEIDGKMSDLDRAHTAFTITSVDKKDFGSKRMHHWEIRGN